MRWPFIEWHFSARLLLSVLIMQPNIIWAQRKDIVMITIQVHDAVDPVIKLEDKAFIFTGKSANQEFSFNTRVDLFGEVDAADEQSKYIVRPRGIEIKLKKKDDTVWWPRLSSNTKELHYISVGWNHWVDEDEEDEAPAQGFDWDGQGMDFGDYGDDDSDDDMEDVPPEGDEPAPEASPEGEVPPPVD